MLTPPRPVGRPRKSPAPAASGRNLLTVAQAAARLGISPRTLERHVYSGRVASHKVFGGRRISDAEVERVLAETEQPRLA